MSVALSLMPSATVSLTPASSSVDLSSAGVTVVSVLAGSNSAGREANTVRQGAAIAPIECGQAGDVEALETQLRGLLCAAKDTNDFTACVMLQAKLTNVIALSKWLGDNSVDRNMSVADPAWAVFHDFACNQV